MAKSTGGSGVAFMRAAEVARKGDDAALLQLLGPAQLIGVPPAPAEGEEDEEWSFRTRAIGHTQASMKIGIELWLASIFPLRKARRGFFAGTIIVGRNASSDVFIDHHSISKLHARIKITGEGAYTIADAGSTNGTWVSTRQVTEKDVPLAYGTLIKIGDFQLKLSRLDQTVALLRSP